MRKNPAILGAAFLMATSAIGPGFLTQTSLFTQELLTSFGFIILISVLLDIGAQLSIWRILAAGECRAQDLANKLLPGMGFFLAALIALGGLVFNIGNFAGCGLGIQVLTGLDPERGAAISCLLALSIFWFKETIRVLDYFTRLLGILMIGLTVYVAFASHPPVGEALYRTIWPQQTNMMMIVTLVGGTVGGYISFAGAHRLLDAGIKGKHNIPAVTKSAVNGILITSLMRFILFFAALGVAWQGIKLSPANPAASVFEAAAGRVGYIFFGIVIWSAAITSVVGASYTSVSFWKTLIPAVRKNEREVISIFIIISTVVFIMIGNPVRLLVLAGAVNGFILPLALAVILLAAARPSLLGDYRHPVALQVAGWIVVVALLWMGIVTIEKIF